MANAEKIIRGNLKVLGQSSGGDVYTLTYASAITIDFDDGAAQEVTLTGSVDFNNPSNAKSGAVYWLKITQDSTGNRSATDWGTDFQWEDPHQPVLSTAGDAVDLVRMTCIGTKIYCKLYKDFDSYTPPA